jgi:hypothetical protein
MFIYSSCIIYQTIPQRKSLNIAIPPGILGFVLDLSNLGAPFREELHSGGFESDV